MTNDPRPPFELTGITLDASEARHRVWPFYVVCDVSHSMWDEERWQDGSSPLSVMNTSLSLMLDTLSENHEAAAIGRISIVTFAGDAQTHYPLTPIDEPGDIHPLPQGTWTNYLAVWDHLNERIRSDLDSLRAERLIPKQPVVFFITDGNAGSWNEPQPMESWKYLHDRLCSPTFTERPRIVALGMGDVDQSTVLAIRSTDPPGPACLAEPGEPASTLLAAIIKVVIKSIGQSTSTGSFLFQVPKGMRRLDTP